VSETTTPIEPLGETRIEQLRYVLYRFTEQTALNPTHLLIHDPDGEFERWLLRIASPVSAILPVFYVEAPWVQIQVWGVPVSFVGSLEGAVVHDGDTAAGTPLVVRVPLLAFPPEPPHEHLPEVDR
jgi:hypothetical protein